MVAAIIYYLKYSHTHTTAYISVQGCLFYLCIIQARLESVKSGKNMPPAIFEFSWDFSLANIESYMDQIALTGFTVTSSSFTLLMPFKAPLLVWQGLWWKVMTIIRSSDEDQLLIELTTRFKWPFLVRLNKGLRMVSRAERELPEYIWESSLVNASDDHIQRSVWVRQCYRRKDVVQWGWLSHGHIQHTHIRSASL